MYSCYMRGRCHDVSFSGKWWGNPSEARAVSGRSCRWACGQCVLVMHALLGERGGLVVAVPPGQLLRPVCRDRLPVLHRSAVLGVGHGVAGPGQRIGRSVR